MARLAGKVAVVTGGTQGIGRGVVLRFLKEGARVVYCSRNPKNNEAMAEFARTTLPPIHGVGSERLSMAAWSEDIEYPLAVSAAEPASAVVEPS